MKKFTSESTNIKSDQQPENIAAIKNGFIIYKGARKNKRIQLVNATTYNG